MLYWPEDAVNYYDVRGSNVTVGVAVDTLVRANNQRVGIVFGRSTIDVFVGISRDISATQGIPVGVADPYPVWFYWPDAGPLPSAEWFAISTGAATTIYVIEVILARHPPEPAALGSRNERARQNSLRDGKWLQFPRGRK